MKIIQIGSYPIDSNGIQGGVEASVYGLSHELKKNHEVIVMDIPRTSKDEVVNDEGVKVYRFNNDCNHNYKQAKRVIDYMTIIKQENPDICHIHSTSYFNYKLFIELNSIHISLLITVH